MSAFSDFIDRTEDFGDKIGDAAGEIWGGIKSLFGKEPDPAELERSRRNALQGLDRLKTAVMSNAIKNGYSDGRGRSFPEVVDSALNIYSAYPRVVKKGAVADAALTIGIDLSPAWADDDDGLTIGDDDGAMGRPVEDPSGDFDKGSGKGNSFGNDLNAQDSGFGFRSLTADGSFSFSNPIVLGGLAVIGFIAYLLFGKRKRRR